MLLVHILIACTGLAVGSYNFVKPRQSQFIASYAFLAATIISGIYITIVGNGHILSACTSGLAYTAVMLGLQYGARARMAHENLQQ